MKLVVIDTEGSRAFARYREIDEEIKKELEYIKNTTIEEMYLKDLKDLRKALENDFPEDNNPKKEKFSGTYKEDTEKAKLIALKAAKRFHLLSERYVRCQSNTCG